MSEDPLWPRAQQWLAARDAASADSPVDLAVIGVPAHLTSISTTSADLTPAAIRAALSRYSTYSWTHDVDLAEVSAVDFGDVQDPDYELGEARVAELVTSINARVLVALGGDNSITFSVCNAMWAERIGTAGLITLDAHHDLRDGISNGSPVRRLIEAGLAGDRVVQIGIADFSNSPQYAARARELGITVIPRSALRNRPIADVMAEALDIAGGAGGQVHVDLDVDVCDRAEVPGCPAAAPGGIRADELRQFAFLAGRDDRVASMDITEIDAGADAADGRTVRLGALCVLEAAAGLALR